LLSPGRWTTTIQLQDAILGEGQRKVDKLQDAVLGAGVVQLQAATRGEGQLLYAPLCGNSPHVLGLLQLPSFVLD
jgi:hypothetical protein